MLRPLTCCFVLVGFVCCAHHAQPPKQAVLTDRVDHALLGDTDVRLLTEALAYDVTHGPWLQALAATTDVAPSMYVGEVPQQVPPTGVTFPQQAFAQSLVQSLRNTHKVTVVPGPDGAELPVWRLDLTAQHDEATVEGEISRGYRIDAALRLYPSFTTAWQKSYSLRKRLLPEPEHVEPSSH